MLSLAPSSSERSRSGTPRCFGAALRRSSETKQRWNFQTERRVDSKKRVGRSHSAGPFLGQWVLSLPIPLRFLLAAQPRLLAPLLQVIHRVIAAFLIKRAGFRLRRADTGGWVFHQAEKQLTSLPVLRYDSGRRKRGFKFTMRLN
jgi:hypothetical protein